MNFETNISEKLKGYAKTETFDTFYESILEIKYLVAQSQKTLKKKMKSQDYQNQKFSCRN